MTEEKTKQWLLRLFEIFERDKSKVTESYVKMFHKDIFQDISVGEARKMLDLITYRFDTLRHGTNILKLVNDIAREVRKPVTHKTQMQDKSHLPMEERFPRLSLDEMPEFLELSPHWKKETKGFRCYCELRLYNAIPSAESNKRKMTYNKIATIIGDELKVNLFALAEELNNPSQIEVGVEEVVYG